MKHLVVFSILVLQLMNASGVHAQGDPKAGGEAYGRCAACHSLTPGMHLSGPSLAELWGKRAASVAEFTRYTPALKKSGTSWDEDTLNAWLAAPGAMVPGTTMTFRGIRDDTTRGNLIAFLRQAMAKDGLDKVVKAGLVPNETAMGQVPPDLSSIDPRQTITGIRHCGDAYFITTKRAAAGPFWEANVRIKIDTSARGPNAGEPVLIRSGMVGDRVSVVFSKLADLSRYLVEKC